jgi:hypothetical protein
MSTAVASPTFNISEPIPGYSVQERIGAGGYGEVWRADAPGGIAKAVKVVYGYRDDARATRELHALNRIKEVRHPFLLSLERIELVDGHLVIVTELADSNIKNLFDEYRRSGVAGIPRGELLSHLRDAAEALDYICQRHSLQHLDVKPENLLLVGGRVKVADFGQVKDLQDVNSSIVSGLTPVYAAPELFDGRPNNRSDQYSLAIVYQEMLTGVLPFEGRTTAQLAAQHLHGRPRLDCLPGSDQATIARALSKGPDSRFSTCCEMIDALLEVTPNHRFRAARPASSRPCPAVPQAAIAPLDTEVVACGALPAHAAAPTPVGHLTEPREAAPEIRHLPPLEIAPQAPELRPTIFVGAGGLAAEVLKVLRRRLTDRFGDLDSVPSLQMLLFDTDPASLEQVTNVGDASLSNDSAILLPLRQSADYRRDSERHLQWLSRRWIYNIPRSGQTQGLRPLGRLAFVDHFERVRDRVARVIQAAVDPAGLAASSRNTGLAAVKGPPRVYLLASTSGGTGSGMVLDLGYLVRKVLRDLGLPDEGICGILAHCAGRAQQARGVAVANAYSLLTELRHYSDPHLGYPGDASCGMPAFTRQGAPFAHAYVVHLGEDLESSDFARAADQLAAYLYCSTASSAAEFFDQTRAPRADAPAGSDCTVRTFGLCQLGFSHDDVPAAVTDEICRTLVARWRNPDHSTQEEPPASMADPSSLLATQAAATVSEEELRAEVARRATAAGLEAGRIVEQLWDQAAREMGTDAGSYLVAVLDKLFDAGTDARQRPSGQSVLDALNGLVRVQGANNGPGVCLETALERHIKELAANQGTALRRWIMDMVASPSHRLEGAQRAAHCTAEFLRALARQEGERAQACLAALRTMESALLADDGGRRAWLRKRGFVWRQKLVADPQVARYFHLRIEELMHTGACRLAGSVLAHVATAEDRLRNLAADLNRLTEEFGGTAGADSRAAGPTPPVGLPGRQGTIAEAVRHHKADVVAALERQCEEDLASVLQPEQIDVRTVLARDLRRKARRAVLRAMKQANMEAIATADDGALHGPVFSLAAGLKAALPRIPHCGGDRRLLIVAPPDSAPGQLVEQLGSEVPQAPTIVIDTEGDMLVCYEDEQLPLRRVAAAVLGGRVQNVEIAARLHARNDVQWSPL